MAALAAIGCNAQPGNEFVLTLNGTSQSPEIVSAFAEYVELPARRSELRIVLATYVVGCENYRAPSGSELLVSIVLTKPAGEAIAPGEYPFQTDPGEIVSESGALPFVRGAKFVREFAPGGTLTLSTFEPKLQGRVTGTFSFLETEPENGKPQAGLRGRYQLRLCRAAPDPARTPAIQ